MKKTALLLLCFAAVVSVTLPLHAQSGCTDSPENPTVILAIVGSAAGLFSTLRSRAKARRRTSR
jgi:XrtJ-associated TM-motif-TM protein